MVKLKRTGAGYRAALVVRRLAATGQNIQGEKKVKFPVSYLVKYWSKYWSRTTLGVRIRLAAAQGDKIMVKSGQNTGQILVKLLVKPCEHEVLCGLRPPLHRRFVLRPEL